MGVFNIYMTGVGGQGIGLLAELLARAADLAGIPVKGCDTHGLAQRGGIVSSHLRLGAGAHSPLVEAGRADLVIALERHEALRALRSMLAPKGSLLWYDASWQPLEVRLGRASPVETEEIFTEAGARGASAHRVFVADLEDAREQNVALVAEAARLSLLPGLGREELSRALRDLLSGPALERNLALFEAKEGT